MKKFIPTVENYISCEGKKMKCGSSIVTIEIYRTESRGGSWERGFNWSNSEWGMLRRVSDKMVSLDHGKTWHANAKTASKSSKGKLRLKSDSHSEFAFEDIQKINRAYYGPSYKWSR